MYSKLWGTSLKYKSRKDIDWQGLWLHKYNQETNYKSNFLRTIDNQFVPVK